ncbi:MULTISPECIES: acetate kinase [unclassified Pseudodesulfovibrio]|uniref:acetate kinase n=1 Tax=unclassified Pseudodesulfovibrio TaxID=2661612 RepID=UPI000FEB759F|nr:MULTISPECIES: acetate kinase [unclassified Pseudodesulfovibrio]MCJ2165022.1 acetate kinase [Pseudodesulfovibrio sp. S3-i]RWU03538.1 acetate kinase [Pseudodesulfovibrio sp. S3]
MKVLVINSGSSSIKYQLLDMENEFILCSGLVERIGEETGSLTHKAAPDSGAAEKITLEQPIPNHEIGMTLAIDLICGEKGVVKDKCEITAIGHRIVHGGETLHQPTLVDDAVVEELEKLIPLAPLHNPGHLAGINVARRLFPEVPQVVVMDTAYHQTLPPEAYMYALPYDLYDELRIRRYGFHGTSHAFVAKEAARIVGKPFDEFNVITVHLGNGCSMTATKNGKAVDTSMGITPLEGLVMGTRSGDVDPALHALLARTRDMTSEQVDTMLNKESGLKGLCGMNDMRDIHAAIEKGDEKAKLALDVQTYRNRKYIGSFMAVLGRVDAIVFTAGIGENDSIVRRESVKGLECFGIKIDENENNQRAKGPLKISTADSAVAIWVIPTNEELAIARETKELVN